MKIMREAYVKLAKIVSLYFGITRKSKIPGDTFTICIVLCYEVECVQSTIEYKCSIQKYETVTV